MYRGIIPTEEQFDWDEVLHLNRLKYTQQYFNHQEGILWVDIWKDSLIACTSDIVGKPCLTTIIRILLDLVMFIYSELYLLLIQFAQQSMISSIMGVL